MLGSIKDKAAKLAASATDAVSDIDLGSVKGKVTTTTVTDVVNVISQNVSAAAGCVKDLASDPADVYDRALHDVMRAAEDPSRCWGRSLVDLTEELIRNNPYRE